MYPKATPSSTQWHPVGFHASTQNGPRQPVSTPPCPPTRHPTHPPPTLYTKCVDVIYTRSAQPTLQHLMIGDDFFHTTKWISTKHEMKQNPRCRCWILEVAMKWMNRGNRLIKRKQTIFISHACFTTKNETCLLRDATTLNVQITAGIPRNQHLACTWTQAAVGAREL